MEKVSSHPGLTAAAKADSQKKRVIAAVNCCATQNHTLTESRQLYEVIVGNPLYWISSLAPGAQAAGDDKYFESELL